MQLILLFIVIAGGMGLSIEAGLLGPLAGEVGDLWATFSVFGVGAALTFLLMLFSARVIAHHSLPSHHGSCWAGYLGRFMSSS